jgi:hypothetical protein
MKTAPMFTFLVAKSRPFDQCPAGLFIDGETLCFRSEYGAVVEGEYQGDAYVVESGEYYWGGAKSVAARNEILVHPVVAEAQLADGEGIGCEVGAQRALLEELQEKIAYLRTGAYHASRNALYARISRVDSAEWNAGHWLDSKIQPYRTQISQLTHTRDDLNNKIQACVDALKAAQALIAVSVVEPTTPLILAQLEAVIKANDIPF